MRIITPTFLFLFASITAFADDQAKPPAKNFGKELPRVPARSPAESRKSIVMRDGFRVELVAAEPLVRDPVAIDFDERGRMYIVQLPLYNLYILKDSKERGSIALLEDTNGDGQYEKSTLFADDLNYPTAVACWDGGVFVGDAPDLLYLKDTDGDGKADERKVIFTGFGKDKAGEAHLNSIRWGLDNRFHVSTSLAGGDVTATAAKDAKPVSTRGRGFIFDPRDLTKFELTSGGGQHGMSMDDWGRKFVCSNSVPAQTLMYDDRYVARNPHLKAPAAAVDIAPGGKHTKLFRISPPEPWRVLRTRLRREGQFRGSDEGGTPFGFFTGATGVTIYRGDAWPDEYLGNLLVGDVANNLIYRARLESNGLGLIANRADEGAEFLASSDIWFRPVQFAHAPDGTLFVLDMCRELIEGAAFLPPEFFKHLDAASGNDRGRIYRIAPAETGKLRRKTPQLDKTSSIELVSLLEHRNGWHRDTASRLLFQRQDRSVAAKLEHLASDSKLPEGRTLALYTLDGLGLLDEESVLNALADESPNVRIQALRLAEKLVSDSPTIRAQMVTMIDDPKLQVRYQLAFSLGSVGGPSSAAALAKLAVMDGTDRWMRMAVLSSLKNGGEAVFKLAVSDSEFRKSSHGRELVVALARQIGVVGRNSEIAVVLKSLGTLPESEKALSEAIVQALVEKQTGANRERILAAAGGRAASILADLLNEAKSQATNEKASVAARVDAIRSLRLASFADVQPLFPKLLQFTQPQPIQAAALEAAAEFNEAGVPKMLLGVWPELSPALRASATETLLSRPDWVGRFLDAVEKETVARGDIDPSRIQLLKQHPNKQIAARVGKMFSEVQLTARKEIVEKYQQALKLDGVADRGKQVFKKNCSACHRLEDVGNAVGAELRGIRQRGLASVLLNILDPNREVKPKFQTYVLVTNDGRILTGMIAAETANSITVRRSDGTSASVQRIEIEQIRSSGLSFMPEGLEKEIDQQAMADLLSYLNSIE